MAVFVIPIWKNCSNCDFACERLGEFSSVSFGFGKVATYAFLLTKTETVAFGSKSCHSRVIAIIRYLLYCMCPFLGVMAWYLVSGKRYLDYESEEEICLYNNNWKAGVLLFIGDSILNIGLMAMFLIPLKEITKLKSENTSNLKAAEDDKDLMSMVRLLHRNAVSGTVCAFLTTITCIIAIWADLTFKPWMDLLAIVMGNLNCLGDAWSILFTMQHCWRWKNHEDHEAKQIILPVLLDKQENGILNTSSLSILAQETVTVIGQIPQSSVQSANI